jgi:hypothetical protein
MERNDIPFLSFIKDQLMDDYARFKIENDYTDQELKDFGIEQNFNGFVPPFSIVNERRTWKWILYYLKDKLI